MAKVALTPTRIDIASPIFEAISKWPFADEFVARILVNDIPQRIKYQQGDIWAYLDPARTIVAFGTRSICEDYAALTDGKAHLYIPLLAVHPDHLGLGHGRSVVEHLIRDAVCIVHENASALDSNLFLDVYEDSKAAIGLYEKCGFVTLQTGPLVDPSNGKAYRVMAQRVSR